MNAPNVTPFCGGIPGLFLQFTLRANEGVLAQIQLTRRNFHAHPSHRIAVLALEQNTSIV